MKLSKTKSDILHAVSVALKELESQKYALDQSAIVSIADDKGKIIYVNDKFCDISKYSKEELLGQNHRIINSGTHPKAFFADMWRSITSGTVWRGDVRNKAKDGSLYWVYTTITPITDDNGYPEMYVSIRFDITRQKLLEEQLEDKLRERNKILNRLTVQNRQLEDFCYIISHNLRAPVNNIGMLTGLMKEEEHREEIPIMLEKLEGIASYLSSTLDELINAVQISNQTERPSEPLRFEDILSHNINALRTELDTCGAKIHSDFSAVETVHYHEAYLNSIFQNLLSNAVKYRAEGRTPEIRISSHLENGWVVLRFSDNGLGLDLDQIGDQLFKFKKTFHRHPQAKGIGLYMLKNQIESEGGRINVQGAIDQGLSFEVFLTREGHYTKIN